MILDKKAKIVLDKIRHAAKQNENGFVFIIDSPQINAFDGMDYNQVKRTLDFLHNEEYIDCQKSINNDRWEIELKHKGEHYEEIERGSALFDAPNINISELQYKVLKWINENPKATPADYFFIDPTIDGHIETLRNQGLISQDIDNGQLLIKEVGRTALVEYEHKQAQQTKERRNVNWKYWTPIGLNFLLSIAAIIISINSN